MFAVLFILGQWTPQMPYGGGFGSGGVTGAIATALIGAIGLWAQSRYQIFGKKAEVDAAGAHKSDEFVRQQFQILFNSAIASRDTEIGALRDEVKLLRAELAAEKLERGEVTKQLLEASRQLAEAQQTIGRLNLQRDEMQRESTRLTRRCTTIGTSRPSRRRCSPSSTRRRPS
jgi:septal ring factor EnvC (AmiA/AmiB activator)